MSGNIQTLVLIFRFAVRAEEDFYCFIYERGNLCSDYTFYHSITEAPFLELLQISRQSIDACKEYFRDDLQKADWQLMVELKKLFQIL